MCICLTEKRSGPTNNESEGEESENGAAEGADAAAKASASAIESTASHADKDLPAYFMFSAKNCSNLSNGIISFPPPSYRSVWTASGIISSSLLSG